ncbi:MAG: PAS domain-containing sensor histidine kinase [Rhodospirillales bacterium]|nr:PAS domain-containing sensor histidine kinase [Rhodospirillales bacterium]
MTDTLDTTTWQRFLLWSRRVDLPRKLAVTLAVAAIISGTATYVALTPGPLDSQDPTKVIVLLNIDLILLLLLGAVVARRIALLWTERRSGSAGSKLHGRLVVLFSLVAVTPAILVAVFSALFFNIGVEAWFNERVRTALKESLAVAHAYLEEHQQVIVGDALAMANDLTREGPMLIRNSQRLAQLVATQAAIRSLTEAVVFDTSGRIMARSGFAFSMELSIDQIPIWALERARSGEVAVLTAENDDRVRALVQIAGGFVDTYLYVGRFVDPKVVGHVERTSAAVAEYQRLEGKRSGLEITFSLVFAMVALLLLLVAVWVGLTLATQLAKPIIALIDAAEEVRAGNLAARVSEAGVPDELGLLSRSFNRMTSQLASQRQELIDANRELDERRRFTETVLAGVSAGVIGLDKEGWVTLPNRSACDLLRVDAEEMTGRPLAEIVPEMASLIEAVARRPERQVNGEIKLQRDSRAHILLVRLAAERIDSEVVGYVVTFDDVTELLSAQRKAAWADVARRIAHEIKNPLTPIQLSAERLKRKYLGQITADPDTFVACTDTIIRQVGDIGRMVDEFSDFARMPAPVMRHENLSEIVRQTVFLQRNGYPSVTFKEDVPDEPVHLSCDGRQISQALANLLKNAVEAIEGREGKGLPRGRVAVSLRRTSDQIVVEVEDNGRGLPRELRDRLTEPYVTTRAKGTGLGLAIVKKIVEDHGGNLLLDDIEGAGARVSIIFPASEAATSLLPTEASHGV